MTAIEFLQALAQIVWLVIGVTAVVRAVRRPSRASVDIALFLGLLAAVLVWSRLAALVELPFEAQAGVVTLIGVWALPYLLLQLAHDFAGVRVWVRGAALVGYAISVAISLFVPSADLARNVPALVFLIGYVAVVSIYSAARFAYFGRTSYGMTRRRMQFVGLGSYLFGVVFLLAGIGALAPGLAGVFTGLSQLCSLGAALAYGIGFTPPNALKRYWQLPELRAFLARSSTLPRSSMSEIVDDLAGVAGRALGARATIGLWDEAAGVVRFRDPHGALPPEMGPGGFIAWRSFASQRPLYVPDVSAAHPANAPAYQRAGVGPILVAPITAGQRRLGVIEVFASREPIFAEDDLEFVTLMAQQAAVILESRTLIDDAARVKAQEETARMKEDFVSAAAHDLKTPLTTILAQAQLLERRAQREGRTTELDGIRRLIRESDHLSRLVEEILDASRIERGSFPLDLEECDLVEIAGARAARDRGGRERIELDATGPVRGRFDPDRMGQLIENLLENAIKYSPGDSKVRLRVWRDDGVARLSVTDHGIGIPAEDMPHVFDRFRRGTNVDHRRFSGIGLGLFICRGIVEQHGGTIGVRSVPGRETTFDVAVPLAPATRVDADTAPRDAVASPAS